MAAGEMESVQFTALYPPIVEGFLKVNINNKKKKLSPLPIMDENYVFIRVFCIGLYMQLSRS